MIPLLLVLGCTGHEEGATVTLAGAEWHPRLLAEGAVTVEWRIDGDTVTPVLVGGDGGGGTVSGVALVRDHGADGDATWERQGYQSWSWSGRVDLTGIEPDGSGWPSLGGDGDTLSVLEETGATSWWAGALESGADRLFAGALSAEVTRTWLAADTDAVWIGWGNRGERIPVAAGETRELDPFLILADPADPWVDWADRVAHAPPDAPPPVGWSDWYTFYGTASEDDIRGNLAVASELDGLDLFQVDDGWEVAWGDWTARESFPSGTAGLAAAIRAEGLTPGLWLAPLYVDRSTATWAAHPDWFLHDAAGEEIRTAACDCATLDLTHPDAAGWIAGELRRLRAEGWAYFKLDFLYAAALEGERWSPMTGIEAYRVAMETLTAATGDAWVLACGAPLLPSVGHVQSFRSGADIAFSAAPDPDPAFLRWQARQTAARAFANGRWWWNDPDNLLIRAPFDLAQVRGAIAAQVASGGAWLLGDDLRTLPADRLAWAVHPALLARRGQIVTPDEPAQTSGLDGSPFLERATPDDVAPVHTHLADGTDVYLNLGEEEVVITPDHGVEFFTGSVPSTHGVDPGDGEVWTTPEG